MTLRLYIYIHIGLLMCDTQKFWILFSVSKASERSGETPQLVIFRD